MMQSGKRRGCVHGLVRAWCGAICAERVRCVCVAVDPVGTLLC